MDVHGFSLFEQTFYSECIFMIQSGCCRKLFLNGVALVALEENGEIFFKRESLVNVSKYEFDAVVDHRVGTLHEKKARDGVKDAHLQLATLGFNALLKFISHVATVENLLSIRQLNLALQNQQLFSGCLVIALL